MKVHIAPVTLLLIISTAGALARDQIIPPSKLPTKMEMKGQPLATPGPLSSVLPTASLDMQSELPTARLSVIAQQSFRDLAAKTRSAKDAQIYRTISPSVVLIATKEGLGSGSLVSTSGEVITNWHVVKGYAYVGVVFKPTIEGREPTRDEIKRGQVVKYDEVADLALVKVSEVPTGRNPIRFGDSTEIAIGSDVHAIGHPTGQAWTYTTGVISQYRQAYEWQSKDEDIKHKADIIQTQTPINPGNSGGPLISDAGTLIGVNSFKTTGEG